jgi:ADP-ribosyl-[dinitrogen reductase] hydrolase
LESTLYEDHSLFYLNTIKEIIQEGGDTDTNASIVGAMIGSLVGILQVPDLMIDKIMSFNCTGSGRIRPDMFSVQKYGVRNILKLI